MAADGSADRKKQTLGAELCAGFKKVLDGYKLYDRNHQAHAQFQEGLHAKLSAFLEQYEELEVEVSAFTLSVAGKAGVEAQKREDSISHPLFLDGVKKVVFTPGLSYDEVGRFMRLWEASFADVEGRDTSFVTRFWEAAFTHLRVEAVETFAEGTSDKSEKGKEKSTDQIQAVMKELMSGRLGNLGSGGATARVVRATREDLALMRMDALADLTPEDLARHDAPPEAGLQGLDPKDAAALSEELQRDHGTDLKRSVRALALGAVGGTPAELDQVGRVVGEVFVNLSESGHVLEVAATLKSLAGFVRAEPRQVGARSEVSRRILQTLEAPKVLDAAAKALEDPLIADAGVAVLSLAPASTVGPLIDRASGLGTPEARSKILELAVGKNPLPDMLAAPLPRTDEPVALELLRLAGVLGAAHGAACALAGLSHPAVGVRRASLKALPKADILAARSIIENLVLDPVKDLRRAAGDALLTVRHEGLTPLLEQLLGRPDVDDAERKWVYFALGRLGGQKPAAILLKEFAASREQDVRCSCALALGTCGDPSARPALQAVAGKFFGPKELKEACREALQRLQSRGAPEKGAGR